MVRLKSGLRAPGFSVPAFFIPYFICIVYLQLRLWLKIRVSFIETKKIRIAYFMLDMELGIYSFLFYVLLCWAFPVVREPQGNRNKDHL